MDRGCNTVRGYRRMKPKGYYSKAAKAERAAERAARKLAKEKAHKEAARRKAEAERRRMETAEAFLAASRSRDKRMLDKIRETNAEHEAFSRDLAKSLRLKREGENPYQRRQKRTPSIVEMMNNGKISNVMLQAIEDICEVWDAVTGAMKSGGMRLELAGKSSPGPHILSMRAGTWRKYTGIFRPWADRLSAERLSKRRPSLDITIAVVVDRMACSEIDEACRIRNGTTDYIVRRALLLYAQIAGWVHDGTVAEFERAHAKRFKP